MRIVLFNKRVSRALAARPLCCREPTPGGSPATNAAMPDQGFLRIIADGYALHHLETPTGYHFMLTTDPSTGDMRGALWYLYDALLVNFVLKNPLYLPGEEIRCSGWTSELDKFIRSLPAFKAQGGAGTGAAGAGAA
jgi:hypothetical protein